MPGGSIEPSYTRDPHTKIDEYIDTLLEDDTLRTKYDVPLYVEAIVEIAQKRSDNRYFLNRLCGVVIGWIDHNCGNIVADRFQMLHEALTEKVPGYEKFDMDLDKGYDPRKLTTLRNPAP